MGARTPRTPAKAPPTAYAETVDAQRRAADPAASAWVSANAGAGKTHVLVARLVRLLLAGTPPERILCLTFTKAAAAEMATRVFARLARWVTMPDADLVRDLAELAGRPPPADELARARDLFAHAMETPGGLKVQTIHAFCERLLQRFPLEAGVPPEFAILDDRAKATLQREARDHVLMRAVADPAGALGRAHVLVVGWATEDSFDQLLVQAMQRYDLLARLDHAGDEVDFEGMLRRALGVPEGMSRAEIEAALAGILPRAVLRKARTILAGGGKADVKHAGLIASAIDAAAPGDRIAALAALFLTKKGERDRLMSTALAEANAGIHQALEDAQARFAPLAAAHDALAVVEASVALATLAAAVLQRYGELKRARSALDFDDLVRRAAGLVHDGFATEWVLFKLDGGLDHILIDEAQDTSPAQWQLVEALAAEFQAGAGARQDPAGPRTIFAVGDEKQSIYGFQGAEPRLFAEKGDALGTGVRAAAGDWRAIPLTLSFRTVAPVLEAVDRIFADPGRTPGVRPAAGAARVRHVSNRPGDAGLVEIWETERPIEADAGDPWETSASAGEASPPAARLADRIARTIRGWLDGGERLASEDRPVRPGDILILVRRRQPFAATMVAALEAHGVPVAGADRMVLTGQPAVQDLLVLCRFLLLAEDDLSLATVLKSPFCDLGDDDLIALAPLRQGSLWRALLDAAATAPRYAAVADRLKRWRARADVTPPYELLVEILDHDGMRTALLSRLGAEAADAIDELLALAVAYDAEAPPSLEGFVASLVGASHEVKRDMEHGRDEVRVMTVHGAKGLEAPIVFLPDTCAAVRAPKGLVDIADAARPAGMPAPFVWLLTGKSGIAGIEAARDALKALGDEESHRLLYVALTRARDRLYVAGFEGKKGRGKGCWYDIVTAALDDLAPAEDGEGRPVRRLAVDQTAARERAVAAAAAMAAPAPLPECSRRRAPAEPMRLVPLTPSRLAPLDADAEGEPAERRRPRGAEPAAPSPAARAGDHRFLRGTVTHALLEHLPTIHPAAWEAAARKFVEARAGKLAAAVRDGIVGETLAVLRLPQFAPLFGPQSRAEVSIVAELAAPSGQGTSARLTGQIDRLVELEDRILIVDYKTNRPPPTDLADVPDAYVLQLAAYRLALARIFPGRPLHAALLWTDGPRIMAIPAPLLDAAEPRLFLPPTGGQ